VFCSVLPVNRALSVLNGAMLGKPERQSRRVMRQEVKVSVETVARHQTPVQSEWKLPPDLQNLASHSPLATLPRVYNSNSLITANHLEGGFSLGVQISK
jgi:hypothetical protein